jgi:hypothetical protein
MACNPYAQCLGQAAYLPAALPVPSLGGLPVPSLASSKKLSLTNQGLGTLSTGYEREAAMLASLSRDGLNLGKLGMLASTQR